MITVHFNNQIKTIQNGCLLIDLLKEQDCTESYYAVALNRCFVSSVNYATTSLHQGDVIEVVLPMQGG